MKIITTITASLAAVALTASSAFAADLVTKAPKKSPEPTSCFDVAFGGGLQSDYNFRGISQSDKGPSAYAYIEPRCNSQTMCRHNLSLVRKAARHSSRHFCSAAESS